MSLATSDLFELEMFGEGVERRFRKMRPEVEAMPWGTLDLSGIPEEALVRARKRWTGAAFQEHRTGVACCAALRALFECRAPIDLTALAARFPLDELVHVELCSRMAMELGGGTEIRYEPDEVIADASPELPPLPRAADMIVRFFCVGEAVSIPLLRGAWHAARHPLPRAVLGRIVRDEAAHGAFGFAFLDWALPHLSSTEIVALGRAADLAIRAVRRLWKRAAQSSAESADASAGDALAWLGSAEYQAIAARALEQRVRRPLLSRGLPLCPG
ncbi:MAG: hypothetical protein JWM82_2024 [Myxococcales bacterium]|nr:hypothetical protein [Myxococcales bacterium]